MSVTKYSLIAGFRLGITSSRMPRPSTRKKPDRLEASQFGKVPIDRLAEIAPRCRVSRARVIDAGRIVTAHGVASGMEMGLYLLRRTGHAEELITDTACVMEYQAACALCRDDIEYAASIPQ